MEFQELCGGFKMRLATAEDADSATAAFLSQRLALQTAFGAFDFHLIIEISMYSFVIFNAEDKLAAFCSFNDTPFVPGSVATRKVADAGKWARQEASDLGFLTDSLLWLEVFATSTLNEEERFRAAKAFMRGVFTLCPDIQAVLHPSPMQYPVLPQLFKTMSRSADLGLIMCACVRSAVLPTLKIRRAEVEDHDDLMPVIERAQKRGSPLAQVPEVAIPGQPYAVARLIAAQDQNNTVFVAEVDDKLVGMMAITAVISNDYCFNFNLDDYDDLTTKVTRSFEFTVESVPEDKPQHEAPSGEAASVHGSPTSGQASPAPGHVSPTPAEAGRPSIIDVAQQSIDPAASKIQPPSTVVETKIAEKDESGGALITPENNVVPEEKVEEPKTRVVEVEVPSGVTNAFQICMLCIEDEYENQGIDFLRAAFEAEARDYCLVGFPYTSRIHPLLHLFGRVPCRPSRRITKPDLPEACMLTDDPPDPKISNLCLYLLHRDSLAPGFEVRPSMSRDADQLLEFLANFKDCKSIVDLVEHPRKGCSTIVAVLSAQIVGLAMVEQTVPVEALKTHFNIKSLVNLRYYPPENQACITLLALSPVFRHRRRLYLREIMRKTQKTLLYCPIFPDQDLPDVIEDLLLVPSRQHVLMSPAQMWGRSPETIGPNRTPGRRGSISKFSPRGMFSGFDCALYLTTHRLTCRHRIPVNSRILLAGASRTAEAFLHKLIWYPQMQFTNVTLVSPSGFSGFASPAASILDVESGPARSFTRLGIDCQVGLKPASVIDFDRSGQTISLSNGETLTYDIFVMTTGLQDQSRYKLRINAVKEVVRADEFFANLEKIIASLEKLKVPREIVVDGEGLAVVYGANLEGFYTIQLLLSKGIRGSNILLVHPEKKLCSRAVHGDANVLCSLNDELTWSQVTVKSGLKLVGVTMNDSGSLKCAVFEKKNEEDEEDIQRIEQPCCLLVTCDRKQVDIPLFNVMRRENIIFDGRVVVDGKFQTNDPLIYAAGTACKFSRRCGKIPKLETFCSREVGEALAASLISRFKSHLPDVGKLWLSILPWFPDGPKERDGESWPAPFAPVLGRPKCTGGVLPGGVQFFCIILPSCYHKNWDDLKIYSMLTNYNNFYVRMDVVESKQLGRVLYAGKVKTDPWKLNQVVGLPVSLLNNLPKRYSEGDVNDIIGFLLQPWSAALFHDEFPPFYSNLALDIVQTIKSHPKGGPQVSLDDFEKLDTELTSTVSVFVKKQLIKFIDERKTELPMYTLPRKKVDLRLLLPRAISSDDFETQEKKKQAASAVAATASAALVAAADLLNTAFEQLISKAEQEERDKQEIKQIIDELLQGMEELKPVLMTLKGEGYMGPTVDSLLEQIEKRTLRISVWDESLEMNTDESQEEDIKRVIEGMIELLEQTSPVMLSFNEVD